MPKGYRKDGTPIVPPRAGKGRQKGAINIQSRDLKAMVLGALHQNGGMAWLAKQAKEYPAAFFGLIGRLIPLQTEMTLDGQLGTYDISDKPLTSDEWAAQANDHLAATTRTPETPH